MSRASSAVRLLGLARRARAVAYGTEAVRQSIRAGEASLVLLAGDASPVQLDKIRKSLDKRPVRQASLADRAVLGAAIGVAPVSAVAVTSASFADRIAVELGRDVRAAGVVEAAVAAAAEE